MAIQGVEDVSLAKIPYFQGGVVGGGEQVPAVGVEVNFVDVCAVSVIVLNESLASDVPDFDGFVLGATGHAGAVRMELD